MDNKVRESIEATRKGFEASFKEQNLYNMQTKDDAHVAAILEVLPITSNMNILDLGTGSGYLAFALARRYPNSKIVGLDVVDQTLEVNRRKAADLHMVNIDFVSYDGVTFPFNNQSIDVITTRYALHHFPTIKDTFQEISRVLKKDGYLFIADPTPNDNDKERFVDDYMRMKKDGHIKYYEKAEFEKLAKEVNLELVNAFQTEICFPRLKETAYGFDEIMKKHKREIIESYKVEVTPDNTYIYTTQKVWNLLFKKVEGER